MTKILKIDEFAKPTNTFSIANSAVGTSRVGVVDATYQELVEIFGEPQYEDENGDKVTCEWDLRDRKTNTVFTIYDYKSSVPYFDNTEWHVGGYNKDAFNIVKNAIDTYRMENGINESKGAALSKRTPDRFYGDKYSYNGDRVLLVQQSKDMEKLQNEFNDLIDNGGIGVENVNWIRFGKEYFDEKYWHIEFTDGCIMNISLQMIAHAVVSNIDLMISDLYETVDRKLTPAQINYLNRYGITVDKEDITDYTVDPVKLYYAIADNKYIDREFSRIGVECEYNDLNDYDLAYIGVYPTDKKLRFSEYAEIYKNAIIAINKGLNQIFARVTE